VPYHQHINVELLDAAHCVAAMLLEVPNIAAAENDPRRREISRHYRRNLDAIEAKSFVGPPESARDHIMRAGIALAEGDVQLAVDAVLSLRVWNLWTGRNVDQVKASISTAMRECGLVAYLHTYAAYFDSLSAKSLSTQFGISETDVAAVVSRMIYSGEIAAKWDDASVLKQSDVAGSTIVMHREPPSKLQSLALDFSDRVAALVDSNERTLAVKAGLDRPGFRRGGAIAPASSAAPAGGEEDKLAAAGISDGVYRRKHFDPRRSNGFNRPVYAGAFEAGGMRRGPGSGSRGRSGWGPANAAAGMRTYASGRREYKARGY
jgi:translation initiation factor 3 subunit C